jgi:HPt (histidine-containing phosphotransfer) domain-containing protein
MSEPRVTVDWEQMDMIADGYPPEFIDIFREFAAEIPGLLESLAEAHRCGDSQLARRIAHQVKGSAANFGFSGLSTSAAVIETLAKTGSFDRFDSLLSQARSDFDDAMNEVREKRGVTV